MGNERIQFEECVPGSDRWNFASMVFHRSKYMPSSDAIRMIDRSFSDEWVERYANVDAVECAPTTESAENRKETAGLAFAFWIGLLTGAAIMAVIWKFA